MIYFHHFLKIIFFRRYWKSITIIKTTIRMRMTENVTFNKLFFELLSLESVLVFHYILENDFSPVAIVSE